MKGKQQKTKKKGVSGVDKRGSGCCGIIGKAAEVADAANPGVPRVEPLRR